MSRLLNQLFIPVIAGKKADNSFHVHTTSVTPATFDPSWNVASPYPAITVDWGDGSAPENSTTGLTHTYAAAGTKKATFTCADWTKLNIFDIGGDDCSLDSPSFNRAVNITSIKLGNNNFSSIGSLDACTKLATLFIYQNNLIVSLPDLSKNVLLSDFRAYWNTLLSVFPDLSLNTALSAVQLYGNALAGTIPSFANSPNLSTLLLYSNVLTGTMPSFALNTKLTNFQAHGNLLTGYTAGSFATQKSLATLNLGTQALPNQFTRAAVDAILADLVTSLGIVDRVTCTVTASGNSISAPSAAGEAARTTLISAGWTMNTNRYPAIMAFGDSLSQTSSWPELVGTGYKSAVNTIYNMAIGGATIMGASPSQYTMLGQANLPKAKDADHIFVLLGTNDTVTDATLTAAYEAAIAVMQTRNPDATIYGLGILNRTVMTGVVEKNARIATACTNAGITYVDTSGWIVAADDTSDGLHLNEGGKTKVANEIIALLPA